jgi:hypothetical protein
MAAEEYTATVDELIDGYRAMRAREIPGDRVLASIQAVMEAERGIAAVQAAVRADMQPREVRTLEELDALPDGAVVMAPDGYATNISDSFITGEWMLPATVLFAPNQQGAEQ